MITIKNFSINQGLPGTKGLAGDQGDRGEKGQKGGPGSQTVGSFGDPGKNSNTF